jgi:serine/threonine protein kinase
MHKDFLIKSKMNTKSNTKSNGINALSVNCFSNIRVESKTGLTVIEKFVPITRGLNEISILSKLNQSMFNGFPVMYGYEIIGDLMKITCQYIKGKTLRQWLDMQNEKQKLINAFDLVFENATRTLFALHDAGVLHLDIKPENIIIDDHYHVYLIDFSLSTTYEDRHRIKETSGTFQYLSPEMMLQFQRIDYESDFFSLGKSLLEIIRKNERRISDDHLKALLKLCQIDPNKRKNNMKDLRKTLA